MLRSLILNAATEIIIFQYLTSHENTVIAQTIFSMNNTIFQVSRSPHPQPHFIPMIMTHDIKYRNFI